MSGDATQIPLSNVGPGPDTLTLAELADPVVPADPTTVEDADPAYESILLLLHRDHHCGQCRRQVRAIADRYDEFRERGCQVVSIVPEPANRVREWQERYELPYPICADPDAVAGEDFDQPIRLGSLGRRFDLVGRMPAAFVLDVDDVRDETSSDDGGGGKGSSTSNGDGDGNGNSNSDGDARISIAASHRGHTIMDRPEIDALLTAIDRRT